MVAIRGRTFKKPWQRSCLSSKLKSSSAPIGRKDSWCFHAVESSNAPLLGSTAAEGLPRIGRTSIATRWRFCGLPQSASCSENFVIPADVFGQTLNPSVKAVEAVSEKRPVYYPRRIGLRPSEARHRRQRGSARGQMQKISAGKFHFEPPSRLMSLDHLVGNGEQLVWHREAERLGGLEIDHQLEFGGLHHRQVGGLLAFENPA